MRKVTAAIAASRLSNDLVRFFLALAYLLAVLLYAWQASRRASPTIFSDEIEFTQVSRAIASEGVPSRRGEPYGFRTLYTYLVAPAWWLDDTKAAWEAAKLIGVLVMTSAIFPAYALARMVVSRPWALVAAVAAVAAPPLAYAPYLMEEPIAYPLSTLGLWAIAAALLDPSAKRLVLAAAICAIAPFARGELGILTFVFGAGLFSLAWRSERFRRWRETWTPADRAGAVVLLVGLALAASAEAGHRSEAWYVATGFFKERVLDHGVWSFAALTIGLAVAPAVALLAVVSSPRAWRSGPTRAFVVTTAAALVGFVGYAAIKGAYLSTVYGTVIVERNLIYLVPLAFAALAGALTASLAAPAAIVGASGVVLLVLLNAELRLDQYPYFEAPGLAIASLANRNWAWDAIDVRNALVVAVAVSLLALVLALLAGRRRAGGAVAAVVLSCVVGWSLTAEIYAARGLNTFADRLHDATPKPLDWIDRATDGEPAIYLGQQLTDPNPIWLMEFWNRSVGRVWSLDGSAPAPTLSPDLAAPDGTLTPNPDVRWVVTGNGVEVVGERVGEPRGNATLFRIEPPLRLRYAQNGVSSDGWMGASASFSQYAPDDGVGRGFARVVLSRQGACGANVPTAVAVVRVGEVVVRDKQPALGRVSEVARRTLEPCSRKTVVLRAAVPYHVEVTVSPTFVPAEVDPSSGDVRELGAQIAFDFLPLG